MKKSHQSNEYSIVAGTTTGTHKWAGDFTDTHTQPIEAHTRWKLGSRSQCTYYTGINPHTHLHCPEVCRAYPGVDTLLSRKSILEDTGTLIYT